MMKMHISFESFDFDHSDKKLMDKNANVLSELKGFSKKYELLAGCKIKVRLYYRLFHHKLF